MLKLCKSVLEKVSFDPQLFRKELMKATKWLNKKELSKLNIESEFINGLRITDKQTMDIVEKALVDFNSEIIEKLKKKNCMSE